MHATDGQLIDYLLGEDSARARLTVQRHLRGRCSRCGDRLQRYEFLVRALHRDRDPEPPAEWVDRVSTLLSGAAPWKHADERFGRAANDLEGFTVDEKRMDGSGIRIVVSRPTSWTSPGAHSRDSRTIIPSRTR